MVADENVEIDKGKHDTRENSILFTVQALENVYQAKNDVLQVAVPVKMPRDNAWHEIKQCYWAF